MGTNIHFLKAGHGDAFIIEILGSNNNPEIIVIDGGLSGTFRRYMKPILNNYSKIDLLVLTHTDDDHIKGLVTFFKSNLYRNIEIKEYWANCRYSLLIKSDCKISLSSAKDFDQFLIEKEGKDAKTKWNKDIVFTGNTFQKNEIEYTILSPRQEQLDLFYNKWRMEYKKHNKVQIAKLVQNQLQKGSLEELSSKIFNPTLNIENDYVNSSSIAFILKHEKVSILFLGDARPEIIVLSLKQMGYNSSNNRLKIDYVKISHHGSKNNTSPELLSFIDCNNFLISTNGGFAKSKHPDREVIAWLLNRKNKGSNPTQLFFNYKLSEIEKKAGVFITKEECKTHNCIIKDNVTIIKHDN